jgi:hypothetical protein
MVLSNILVYLNPFATKIEQERKKPSLFKNRALNTNGWLLYHLYRRGKPKIILKKVQAL